MIRAGRAAVALLSVLAAGCSASRSASIQTGGIPVALLREARPIGKGPRFHPPATGPGIGGCQPRLGSRYGVHVEVFGANRVVIVPARIGIHGVRRLSAGRVAAAACYTSLVTLEPTGLVLVRPGSRLALADVFRAWGQPLSSRRLAGFAVSRGQRVRVFVDGRSWSGSPGSVPLSRHAEIVLEVGPYVPPHRSYTFPPGT